jgi:hypothetical protein
MTIAATFTATSSKLRIRQKPPIRKQVSSHQVGEIMSSPTIAPIKHPSLEVLEKQLENAPWEIVGGVRHDPTFNRLADKIHHAAKQFAAVNPNHDFLHVLVFTNSF